MEYSLIKCLYPRRVVNKYTGKECFVACRKCEACLLSQSKVWKYRVEQECNQHAYSIFFTLTYDNASAPFASFQSKDGRVINFSYPYVDTVTGEILTESFCNTEELQKSLSKILTALKESKIPSPPSSVPVLDKRDVQKFFKRLRKRIETKYEKENENEDTSIRYYATGEYGPSTLRPHYHGLIWTDNVRFALWLLENICEAWPHADKSRTRKFTEFAASAGEASHYVSGYVNGISDLPEYLKFKEVRPFRLASKNPSIGYYFIDEKQVCEQVIRGHTELSVRNASTGKFEDVPIPPYLCYKFFPKCRGFGTLSITERMPFYSATFNHLRLCCQSYIKRDGGPRCSYKLLSDVSEILEVADKFGEGFLKFNFKKQCTDFVFDEERSIFTTKFGRRGYDLLDILLQKHLHDAYKRVHALTGVSLLDYCIAVDNLYKKRSLSQLRSQIEYKEKLVSKGEFEKVKYLYPLNYEKGSDIYLGAVREKNMRYNLEIEKIKCKLRRESFITLSYMEESYGKRVKKYRYVDSEDYRHYCDEVRSQVQRRTKTKKVNDVFFFK